MPTPTEIAPFHLLSAGSSGFEATVAVALGHDVAPDSPMACQVGSCAISELHAVGVAVRLAARMDQPPLAPMCLALVESPGATALLTGCWETLSAGQPSAVPEAIESCCQFAFSNGNRLVELLLPPAFQPASAAAANGGAIQLTTLIYLRRFVESSDGSLPPARSLAWHYYSGRSHEMFLSAMEQSYMQSMDCHELAGRRTVEETLAGHRAAGPFDASLWWVATLEGQPVGVLLLCEIPHEQGLELVYVGVAQAARGTGVADALIDRALGLARGRGAKFVALAVDSRNIPARRLYARLRFVEIGAKEVWIALPNARSESAKRLVSVDTFGDGTFHAL